MNGLVALLAAVVTAEVSLGFEIDAPVSGPLPGNRSAPAIAASGSGYLAVWTQGEGDASAPGVYAARLDPTGVFLDPYGILVSSIAGEQTLCAVAGNNNGFLVVWAGPRGSSGLERDIYGARLALDGSLLDQPAFTICGSSGAQCTPAVASNGTNYLVVWRDNRQTGIYGNLVSADGAVSVASGFRISGAAGEQLTPAVAALGSDYLVVWQDYRNATSTRYYSDIYGARVAGSGELRDTNGIPICTATNSQYTPVATALGTNFLVVWEEYDPAGSDLAGVRLSSAGVVLDPAPLILQHGPNAQISPTLTATEDGCLLAWQDFRDSPAVTFESGIRAAKVSELGTVQEPDGVLLSSVAGPQWRPALTTRAELAFCGWQDFRNSPDGMLGDIFGAAVALAPVPSVNPDQLLCDTANAELDPRIACNGSTYLVVWCDNRNAANTGRDILAMRFDQDGQWLDPAPIRVCTETSQQGEPAVAAIDGAWLVVWSDWRLTPSNATHADIFGTLVSPSGEVHQTNGFAICLATNDQRFPVVCANGPNFLVAWQDARSSLGTAVRQDIYGARVSATGQVLDAAAIPICTNVGNQLSPAASGHQGVALVVWTDFRFSSVTGDIFSARVAPDGNVLDPGGVPVCTAPAAQSVPAVANNGSEFLVTWADGRGGAASRLDIYGAKVTADALVFPTNGFPVRSGPNAQTAPDVVFNGMNYFLVWQESEPGLTNSFDLYAAGLTTAAELWSDAPVPITTGDLNTWAPSVAAANDHRFLLVNQTQLYSAPRVTGTLVDFEALPRFSRIHLENGDLQLELRGAIGKHYALEASEDLQFWSSAGTFTATNFATLIVPASPSGIWSRFYRAILLP